MSWLTRTYQQSDSIRTVTINTLYHEKQTVGHYLHHDWQDKGEFIEAYEIWGELKLGLKPSVIPI